MKNKLWFSTYCYYVDYAVVLKKSIYIVLLLILRSTAPWLWQKINYLSFQHCFHYTVIMRVKYCFPIATTFTTRWSRQKINFFSFQHYFHYTIVMRIKLLHNYHEKKLQYPLRKFSVSKTFEHDTIDSPSGISVEC